MVVHFPLSLPEFRASTAVSMAHKLFWHLPPNDKGRLRSYNNKFPRFGNLDQKFLILTIALPGLELSRDGSTNLSAWLEESRWPPSSFCPSIKRNDCEHRFLLASLQVAWTSRPLTFHQWECNDRVSDSSREPGKLVLTGDCVTALDLKSKKGGWCLLEAGGPQCQPLKWDQESGLPPVTASLSASFLHGRKGAALSKWSELKLMHCLQPFNSFPL